MFAVCLHAIMWYLLNFPWSYLPVLPLRFYISPVQASFVAQVLAASVVVQFPLHKLPIASVAPCWCVINLHYSNCSNVPEPPKPEVKIPELPKYKSPERKDLSHKLNSRITRGHRAFMAMEDPKTAVSVSSHGEWRWLCHSSCVNENLILHASFHTTMNLRKCCTTIVFFFSILFKCFLLSGVREWPKREAQSLPLQLWSSN